MLTVIRQVPADKTRWECMCDCGNITLVYGNNLVRGAVKSCGCLKHRVRDTHHKSFTRVYRIYAKIKRRCFSEDDGAYPSYGGRGITMCEEWRKSFEAFYTWSMQNGYSDELSIDRIDNDGDYTPQNCRWATAKEQSNNRRSCIKVTMNGRTQNLKEWCDELGISYKTVHQRINGYNWDAIKALTTPIRKGSGKSNERQSC